MESSCMHCGHTAPLTNHHRDTELLCPSCSVVNMVPAQKSLPEKKPAPTKTIGSATALASQVQRTFLFTILGCFAFLALTGIWGLIAGNFDETKVRILLTTLSLSIYSLVGLCGATLIGRSKLGILATLCIAVAIAGALFACLTNWGMDIGLEFTVKGRFIFLTTAVAMAHACLLLLVETKAPIVIITRLLTLIAIAILATQLIATTLYPDLLSKTWIALAIVCILNAFGTIATAILHLATRSTGRPYASN